MLDFLKPFEEQENGYKFEKTFLYFKEIKINNIKIEVVGAYFKTKEILNKFEPKMDVITEHMLTKKSIEEIEKRNKKEFRIKWYEYAKESNFENFKYFIIKINTDNNLKIINHKIPNYILENELYFIYEDIKEARKFLNGLRRLEKNFNFKKEISIIDIDNKLKNLTFLENFFKKKYIKNLKEILNKEAEKTDSEIFKYINKN